MAKRRFDEEAANAPRPKRRRIGDAPPLGVRRSERIRQLNLENERAEQELQRLELQHQERQRQRPERRQPMRRLAEMVDREPPVLPPPPPANIVGNLLWGRLGKQPYWPAMVAVDEDGLYFKQKMTANGVLRRQFYVEWLADGRRSWVGATYLAPFERPGNPTPEGLRNTLREWVLNHRKCKDSVKALKIPRRLQGKIDAAIEEALELQDNFH
ncbi:histone-lysine N-methyltransferase NSD3-like [Nilaparvata lugens]|uniref:histone-lysine N-methyltransferase NSD3-like n=1 Tax=Nilaparvata lugens TaxID=108931 RepID=UPI00193DFFC0|nr:histone-lysine N-methyltransferase NSD3-like [Nilaparvata lugens]XP_039301018.1 histone-lysine N-methyltransferase NSD3-like [Nilaparvata lugens]